MLCDEPTRAKMVSAALAPKSAAQAFNGVASPVEKVSTGVPASKRWVSRFFHGNGNGGGQGGGAPSVDRSFARALLEHFVDAPMKGRGSGVKD